MLLVSVCCCCRRRHRLLPRLRLLLTALLLQTVAASACRSGDACCSSAAAHSHHAFAAATCRGARCTTLCRAVFNVASFYPAQSDGQGPSTACFGQPLNASLIPQVRRYLMPWWHCV